MAPPDTEAMPRGTWIYDKGEAQVWCDQEDPYYSNVAGSQLQVTDGEDTDNPTVSVFDHRLDDYGCNQDFMFFGPKDAEAPLGLCGYRVLVIESKLELVSPHVLYARRYYDVDNPYLQDDSIHCRIFESGYLIPIDDFIQEP